MNNGNRKIAYIIDISTSMFENDADSMRLQATIALNDIYLISKEKAKPGQTPDLLTIIEFNEATTVLYKLGNPGKAADESIANFMPGDGTFIGGGVKAAVDELSKFGSGIKSVDEKGIHVSMGYMAIGGEGNVCPAEQNVGIHDAVITTGGTMGRVSFTQAIGSFLVQATREGLTNSDKRNQGDALDILPGVTTSAKLKTDGPNVFKYKVFKDETITVNVTALEKFAPLKVSLRQSASDTELQTVETNGDGVAILKFEGTSEMDLSIKVSSPVVDAKGVFIVGLGSDVDCTNHPQPGSPSNVTIPPITPTIPPTAPPVIPSITAYPSANWTIPMPTETSSVVMYTGAANANTAGVGLGWVGSMFAVILAF